jgi:hypothetical protein
MRNLLQRCAILFLIAASLSSIATHWQSTRNIEKGSEALDRWEAQLQPAREALPIKRGILGYVGEWDVPGTDYEFLDQETEFILTQYALAPLILVRGPVAEWNIAILNREAFQEWEADNRGVFEITHLGRNIYLLRKLGNP